MDDVPGHCTSMDLFKKFTDLGIELNFSICFPFPFSILHSFVFLCETGGKVMSRGVAVDAGT